MLRQNIVKYFIESIFGVVFKKKKKTYPGIRKHKKSIPETIRTRSHGPISYKRKIIIPPKANI